MYLTFNALSFDTVIFITIYQFAFMCFPLQCEHLMKSSSRNILAHSQALLFLQTLKSGTVFLLVERLCKHGEVTEDRTESRRFQSPEQQPLIDQPTILTYSADKALSFSLESVFQ